MSRKHSKQSSRKQPVERILVKPEVTSKERVVTEVPEGTDGAIPITQQDGTVKFFVVSFKVVTQAVYKTRALGPTTTRGEKNDPKNMAPKGKAGMKTGPQPGGKK